MAGKPFEFFNALRKQWGSIVTSGAVIGGLGIWQGLGHAVPRSVYWIIAIIGLVLALYKIWEFERIECEAIRAELGREKSLHGGPEISFGWGAIPPLNTRKTLFIENSGPIDAYEIRIGDIGLNTVACAAQFPVVSKCAKGSREALKFELVGNSLPPHSHRDEIEMVIYASGVDFPKDDKGNDVVDFPIAISYEEYGGARYEANFRFLADTYLQDVNIRRVSRKRVN